MVEILDLVLQSRCIKCSHEIIQRRFEHIVVIKVNRYYGERIRRLRMRRDNPDHFHTLLPIHSEHNPEDLCSSQVQESQVNFRKALRNFSQIIKDEGITANVDAKLGVLACCLEFQHTSHNRGQQV